MSRNSPTRICESAAAQAARSSLSVSGPSSVRVRSPRGASTRRNSASSASGSHQGSSRLLNTISTLASASGSRTASAHTSAKGRSHAAARPAMRSMPGMTSTAMTRALGIAALERAGALPGRRAEHRARRAARGASSRAARGARCAPAPAAPRRRRRSRRPARRSGAPTRIQEAVPSDPRSRAELVSEKDADEHRHAEIVVVEKRPEAGIAVAVADQPQLIEEEASRRR